MVRAPAKRSRARRAPAAPAACASAVGAEAAALAADVEQLEVRPQPSLVSCSGYVKFQTWRVLVAAKPDFVISKLKMINLCPIHNCTFYLGTPCTDLKHMYS